MKIRVICGERGPPSLPWGSAALNPRTALVPSRLPGVDGTGDFVDAEAERGREAQGGGSGGRVEAGEEGGDVLLEGGHVVVRLCGDNDDALRGAGGNARQAKDAAHGGGGCGGASGVGDEWAAVVEDLPLFRIPRLRSEALVQLCRAAHAVEAGFDAAGMPERCRRPGFSMGVPSAQVSPLLRVSPALWVCALLCTVPVCGLRSAFISAAFCIPFIEMCRWLTVMSLQLPAEGRRRGRGRRWRAGGGLLLINKAYCLCG